MERKKPKNLKVYYGWIKLTKKIIRKPELAIFFENGKAYSNEQFINRRIKVIYERMQTPEEMEGCINNNRMFTKYGYFINEKPYFGNLDRVLHENFLADANHLSKKKREELRLLLKNSYYSFYNLKPTNYQTSIKFS